MKDAQLSCEEADLKDYDLLCFRQQDSDRIFSLYYGMGEERAERISAFRISLMDVEVREPIRLRMPLVIDFGSTNTTAGVYLDSLYFENARGALFVENFEKNAIQYTIFEDGRKLMPSVVGVISVKHGKGFITKGDGAQAVMDRRDEYYMKNKCSYIKTCIFICDIVCSLLSFLLFYQIMEQKDALLESKMKAAVESFTEENTVLLDIDLHFHITA